MSSELTFEPTESTSISSEPIEFRCTRCWNSNVADCSAAGSAFECLSCGNSLTVPDPTPERIARAKSLLQENPPVANPERRALYNVALSDQELIQLANEELRVPLDQQDFTDYQAASLWSRFFAQMIDSFLLVGSIALSFVLMIVLFGKELDKSHAANMRNLIPLMVFAALPSILCVVQWALIATEGQTVGKKLLLIRIVTMQGRLPGFVQGVLLRQWLRVLLGTFIPFFGLMDALFALGESRRSLHDLLSATRVVQLH